MSCAELNLYKNGELIDEESEPRFYRSVREMLNTYHHTFSRQWDEYCETLDIREIDPIEMSVQNQPFFLERGTSTLSKMGKRKKTKRTKKKQDKRRKKTIKK